MFNKTKWINEQMNLKWKKQIALYWKILRFSGEPALVKLKNINKYLCFANYEIKFYLHKYCFSSSLKPINDFVVMKKTTHTLRIIKPFAYIKQFIYFHFHLQICHSTQFASLTITWWNWNNDFDGCLNLWTDGWMYRLWGMLVLAASYFKVILHICNIIKTHLYSPPFYFQH